jgi:hypothetical protein
MRMARDDVPSTFMTDDNATGDEMSARHEKFSVS